MITGISGATSASSSAAGSAGNSPLDRDAFLKLLIAQLGNQDPLKPMDDSAFIAELAQFSSLEQMRNINETLSPLMSLIQPMVQNQASFEAVSWIGRTVTAQDPDPPTYPDGKLVDPVTDSEGNPVKDSAGNPTAKSLTARVDSVTFTADGPMLNITVHQKVYDVNQGIVVEQDVKKEIQLGGVVSLT
ncbi:MAG TPA: flagellar hook capping FlgD N-terminal domain-containing protein [Armatimonadota bacterium]|nr:flagellar hook capping FlgD N-terminal domain-containing protein [Armatimonadota bacterium]